MTRPRRLIWIVGASSITTLAPLLLAFGMSAFLSVVVLAGPRAAATVPGTLRHWDHIQVVVLITSVGFAQR